MNAMTTTIANDSYPMTALQVYFREARAELVRAWRTPAFVLPTLLMPLAFYCLFGILFAGSNPAVARDTLAAYGIMAALAPALFGFGAGIAADRDNGILALKRVSPLPPGAFSRRASAARSCSRWSSCCVCTASRPARAASRCPPPAGSRCSAST